MKKFLYFIVFFTVACSKQEAATELNNANDPNKVPQATEVQPANTGNTLVGNWKFYKSEDSKIAGVTDYIVFPEFRFKADHSGSTHFNYIYPVAPEEAVKNFSYAIETSSPGVNKPLILTLKYSDDVKKYEVSFGENADILILTTENTVTGSIISSFFKKVK